MAAGTRRVTIELPFPPATLSGHAKGHWRSHAPVVAKHRGWARAAALAAKIKIDAAAGDIPIHFALTPPDNRGDRTNYPNRLKPYIDGIAEALRINDRRFLPSYSFLPPIKPGSVVVTLCPA